MPQAERAIYFMNPTKLEQIALFAGGVLSQGEPGREIGRISTDSRTVKRGELFVALRGENFNGH